MRTRLWIVLALPLLFFACSSTPPKPPFKPVATVKQLMTAIIIPSSDVLFQVAGKAPTNDEEWAVVERNAMMLVESGNLLMIGDRAKDNGGWMTESQKLVDVGVAALKAVQAKNVDEISKVGDQMYEVCEGCHNKYTDKAKENK